MPERPPAQNLDPAAPTWRIVTGDAGRHADGILAIVNHEVIHSTAIYEYVPRSAQAMAPWFDERRQGRFPLFVAEDRQGGVLGYASYGTFRLKPAYKYTVEHSVYLRADARGQGLGRVLLTRLVEEATARGVHAMVGAVDADNVASIALHRALAFEAVARMPQVGFKFGRWLDLVFMQRLLPAPAEPVDG